MTKVETRPRPHYTRGRPTGKPRKYSWRTLVPPALAASAPERARAVQALLDKHGPEMDRRRELTPEVVDALAGQDLLRMLLPKSMGGQEMPLVEYCKACEAMAWADASSAWFVNQSNVSAATSAAAMPHEAAAADVRRPACRPGLGRAAQQQHGDPRRGRLSADRHLELRQRRPPHQDAGRAQRRAEPRRHAAHPLRPAGRPQLRVPALSRPRSSTTGTCSACAAPAATAIRSRTCSFPTPMRRRATSPTSGARRARSIPSARPCSMPAASAA